MTRLMKRVELLWSREQEGAIANVLKQASKIEKDPTDVKVADVEKAISDFEGFIEEPTEELEVAYYVCVEFMK